MAKLEIGGIEEAIARLEKMAAAEPPPRRWNKFSDEAIEIARRMWPKGVSIRHLVKVLDGGSHTLCSVRYLIASLGLRRQPRSTK